MSVALLAAITGLPLCAQSNDLSRAEIVLSPSSSPVERQAAVMLQEEVEKRTGLTWPITATAATLADRAAHIILVDHTQIASLPRALHLHRMGLPASWAPESFALRPRDGGRTVIVVGADQRGVLFGAGYLLRHLDMDHGRAVPHDLARIDSAPAYPVRGHQLGYRPKNNTFDAWTPARFEQYIRDLAIFGTNTIEIIPPRSDDEAVSPLYTLPPLQMMIKLSEILDRYGLNCSIWYPALDKDYSDPRTVAAAVAEWGAIFDRLPRIDALFVPGGDPGHTEPKYLFALLEKEAARLRQRHPHAEVWVSPQSFSAQWLDEFYALLAENPRWLTGVVYGPEMRDSPEQFRRRVPARYPIRFYPDITHVLDAQYPVPNWDPAFALTEGREPINPRPQDQSTLFHRYAPLTEGFVAYSEGSNDDVNKILWSGWGWDPHQSAAAILEEYARVFLSSRQSLSLATAIGGLEADWRGPVADNRSIEPTLARLQSIERDNPALAKTDWRFEQLLYRGYYDAYVQRRFLREQTSEQAAVALLQKQPLDDARLESAAKALAITVDCSRDPTCRRLQALAGDLFRNIGMQLSVTKYHALAVGRGANLDRVDEPLTDAVWLRSQLAQARAEPDPAVRGTIVNRALDVLGVRASGTYDRLGEGPAPHLLLGKTFAEDPSGLQGTYRGVYGNRSAAAYPLAWRTFAGTLYDRPLEMLYRDLTPHRTYVLHVRYITDARRISLLANGTTIPPSCNDDRVCLDAAYVVPAHLLPKSELRIAFSGPKGLGGNGRTVAVATVRVSPLEDGTHK